MVSFLCRLVVMSEVLLLMLFRASMDDEDDEDDEEGASKDRLPCREGSGSMVSIHSSRLGWS